MVFFYFFSKVHFVPLIIDISTHIPYTRDLYWREAYLWTLHFVPLAHALLGVLLVLHSSSLVAHCYSYNLHFLATMRTLVDGFMWPLIVTIGNLELDLGFFFPFSFRLALLGALSFLEQHA